MSHPATQAAATAGAALGQILTSRLGGDPSGIVAADIESLGQAVDAHFARNTGTITITFTGNGLVATFSGDAPARTVEGDFANQRTISITDELVVSGGVLWQRPIERL